LSAESQARSRPAGALSVASERIVRLSEVIVVSAAGLLVVASVTLAAGTMFALFINGLRRGLQSIDSIQDLQVAVQRVFAGVLLLMLGLELLETLKSYFTESRIKIEVILIVALIAVGRHIMLIDIEHTDGAVLLGAAALTLALALSYILVRSRRDETPGG
jgi:uncharacterized membrane protein (DUF373 family)